MMPEIEEPQERPEMPAVLIEAAIQGNRDFLVQCLGLPADEEPDHLQMQIDTPEPTLGQVQNGGPESSHGQMHTDGQPSHGHMEIQTDIRSATKSGNTILHLLVFNKHNNLAIQVCRKDMSLLKARNKRLETPLHYAAKVGNKDIFLELNKLNPSIVKEVLGKTDDNGDKALHVAVKHGNTEVACVLMDLGPGVAYEAKNELSSVLYIAIANGCTEMAKAMLKRDATLACIEDSNGMFPVHLVARMGNLDLLKHFIEEYPDYAELLDPCGRNLFHIAAEENCDSIFRRIYYGYKDFEPKPKAMLILPMVRKHNRKHNHKERFYYENNGILYNDRVKRMISALDHDGNTPLHIAAMKGHISIMRAFWVRKINTDALFVRNKQGLRPLELCSRHLKETREKEKVIMGYEIDKYIMQNGEYFSRMFIHHVLRGEDKNAWDRIQVIGLGAVLITTVAFAAAFTIPGGYNQENGTPVLGRRYIFRAFILANALAFLTAFMSLFALLLYSLKKPDFAAIRYALYLFLVSSSSMVLAFGLGMYVTLAPTNMDIAIFILVLTLFMGSLYGHGFIVYGKGFIKFISGKATISMFFLACLYVLPFLWIFCLAFL